MLRILVEPRLSRTTTPRMRDPRDLGGSRGYLPTRSRFSPWATGRRSRLGKSLQAPFAACCDQLLELRGVHLLQLFQGARTSRKPDRLIDWAGERVVCEVKEFGADVVKSTGRVQMVGDKQWYRPIRTKVHEAAHQLRELAGSGKPLVVVLANPQGMFIPLTTGRHLRAVWQSDVHLPDRHH